MVVGFNHNFKYKGVTFHIQTEDGGLGSPNIITLLYHGGTILASRKTSYLDIIKADQLEKVVEDLMKEQHKGMLRSLKGGEFDDVIQRYLARSGQKAASAETPAPESPTVPPKPAASAKPAPQPVAARPAPEPAVTKPAVAKPSPAKPAVPAPRPEPVVAPAENAPRQQKKPASPPPKPVEKSPAVAASLDEIVLSYLMGDEK